MNSTEHQLEPNAMSRQFSSNKVWAIILVLGFGYLLLGICQPLGIYDEGLIVYGAERVMHGQLPYRDFAAHYTPGQFYTLAEIFRLFGCSILVERVWDSLVRFGVCVLTLLISRRLVPKKAALFAPLISLLFLGWCGNYAYNAIPALFFSLLSILIVLLFYSQPRTSFLFLAGVATGTAALYRQDIGAFAFLSIACTLMVSIFSDSRFKAANQGRARQSLDALFRYGAGVSIILVPMACYFLAAVPRDDLQRDFLGFLNVQAQFRSLPLPPLIPSVSFLRSSWALGDVWFLFYAPLIVYVVSIMGLIRSVWKAEEQVHKDRQHGRTLLTVFGLLLYLPALARPDLTHCLAPTLPACILVVLLLVDRPSQRRWPLNIDPVGLGVVVLAVPYLLFPIAPWCGHLYTSGPWKATSALRRARHFRLDPHMEDAVRFVQNVVPEGREIFVGNAQHHQVFVSNVLFYFLSERGAGTRFYDFIPGIITTAPVQQKVIADLEKNHVEYVVLCASADLSRHGNEVPPDSGVTILDDYLRERYLRIRDFGGYSILQKKPVEAVE